MNKKAVIAMSGGVDSAVAAFMMKRQNVDCTAVTMKLFLNNTLSLCEENSCCSLNDIDIARKVAASLGMEHHLLDFSENFKEKVIDNFVHSYETGATPNPCIECNRHLKFTKIFSFAQENDCDFVVTGHYARIEFDEKSGRYVLKKALDKTKDQSYVLYSLTQDQLSHTIFPLGEMEKLQVRKIAQENGFENADKKDSQDICFIPDGKYASFIESYTKKVYPEGDFVDSFGNVLGTHKGIIRYTIGQRKGLGLALSEPMYVTKLDLSNNTVVLGKHEELFTKTLTASNINLISVENLSEPMRVKAKVRYRQEEQWATAIQTDIDTIKVEFDEPQRAITKGQSVVLYDGDTVVGGGIIEKGM